MAKANFSKNPSPMFDKLVNFPPTPSVLDTAKIIGMDGKEIELELPKLHQLFTYLRQEELSKGHKSVVVEVGAWRILVTLMGDISEPLNKQLLETRQ